MLPSCLMCHLLQEVQLAGGLVRAVMVTVIIMCSVAKYSRMCFHRPKNHLIRIRRLHRLSQVQTYQMRTTPKPMEVDNIQIAKSGFSSSMPMLSSMDYYNEYPRENVKEILEMVTPPCTAHGVTKDSYLRLSLGIYPRNDQRNDFSTRVTR